MIGFELREIDSITNRNLIWLIKKLIWLILFVVGVFFFFCDQGLNLESLYIIHCLYQLS